MKEFIQLEKWNTVENNDHTKSIVQNSSRMEKSHILKAIIKYLINHKKNPNVMAKTYERINYDSTCMVPCSLTLYHVNLKATHNTTYEVDWMPHLKKMNRVYLLCKSNRYIGFVFFSSPSVECMNALEANLHVWVKVRDSKVIEALPLRPYHRVILSIKWVMVFEREQSERKKKGLKQHFIASHFIEKTYKICLTKCSL